MSYNNIYHDMNQELYELSIEDEELETQKQLIEKTFIKFTKGYFQFNTTSQDLTEVLQEASSHCKNVNIFDAYTHVLLSIMSNLQNFHIVWMESEEDDYRLTRDNDGKFNTLYTPLRQPALSKFQYLFNEFKTSFNITRDTIPTLQITL